MMQRKTSMLGLRERALKWSLFRTKMELVSHEKFTPKKKVYPFFCQKNCFFAEIAITVVACSYQTLCQK
ncbi:MAG: hypothetical protein ACJARW_000967 [Methylophilaceae bacterium]|jgi:hypothetical protein